MIGRNVRDSQSAFLIPACTEGGMKMDTGLLMLRIIVGLLLVGHGTRRLFGWFGGRGLAGTARYFRSVGYWPPKTMASLAITAEIVGGAFLAAGFMTPLAAAVVIAAMLNAVAIHWRNGLWAADNGFEYPVVMATVAATLAFTGAGSSSLDARVGVGGASIEAGLFAVAIGLLAGAAVLVSRAAARSEGGPAWEPKPTRLPMELAA
jgi:putative oxidoreductase